MSLPPQFRSSDGKPLFTIAQRKLGNLCSIDGFRNLWVNPHDVADTMNAGRHETVEHTIYTDVEFLSEAVFVESDVKQWFDKWKVQKEAEFAVLESQKRSETAELEKKLKEKECEWEKKMKEKECEFEKKLQEKDCELVKLRKELADKIATNKSTLEVLDDELRRIVHEKESQNKSETGRVASKTLDELTKTVDELTKNIVLHRETAQHFEEELIAEQKKSAKLAADVKMEQSVSYLSAQAFAIAMSKKQEELDAATKEIDALHAENETMATRIAELASQLCDSTKKAEQTQQTWNQIQSEIAEKTSELVRSAVISAIQEGKGADGKNNA